MAAGTRRVVGVVLALGLLGGTATLYTRQHAAFEDQARTQAHQAAEAGATKLKADLAAAAAQVASRAKLGAALPAFSSIMGINIDEADPEARQQLEATIVDAIENEAWWAPYRDLGMTAFFIGGQPVHLEGPPELAAELRQLVRDADTGGRASTVLAHDGKAWLAGAAVVPQASPRQQRGVLVLLQPLTAEGLKALVGPRAAAAVTAGSEPLVAGDADAQALLQAFLAAKDDASACCAAVEAAKGVEAAFASDASGFVAQQVSDAQRAQMPLYGVSVALVAAALFFGFRPAPKVDAAQQELLKQTAAELQASREELRRLSMRLSGPELRAAATPAGVAAAGPADDGLGATAASVVSSRYHLIAPLGEGGMAKVSLAEVKGAEGFRRIFVVKRLRPELAGNTELVNQFIDEARLGASLVHSNIVPVFDFGRDAEGYYLAQEYILGRDVDHLVQASLARRRAPLEQPLVLYLAQETLKALAYAHTKTDDAGRPLALVHRDVSPNNLMVSARGEVKLLDFGIVKSEQRLTKTQTGVVKGNLFYMSPEQAKGLGVDARADLFSLGLVLYYAVTGTTLYQGATTYELIARAGAGVTAEDRARVEALGGPLAPLLLKALSNDPAGRYESADAFARAVAGTGVAATSGDFQRLVDALLRDELAAEQGRLSRGA